MRPNLIHKQQVVIGLQDRSGSNRDDAFQEPVQHKLLTTVTILAQVNYGTPAQLGLLASVAFAEATGYLVTHSEGDALSIKPGDIIQSINGESVSFRIGQAVPSGFYSGLNTLIYIPFFENRV